MRIVFAVSVFNMVNLLRIELRLSDRKADVLTTRLQVLMDAETGFEPRITQAYEACETTISPLCIDVRCIVRT